MQNHAADRADDVGPQLQQPVAQPRHLAAGTRSTRRPQSQFLHEHVGRGGQEDAQLRISLKWITDSGDVDHGFR